MAFGSVSARSVPLPAGWRKIRAQRLEIDGYMCQAIRGDTGGKCLERATDVDHVGDPSDHRLEMLQSLCRFHHARKTGRQGGQAVRKGKPAPYHPGIISR